MRPDPRASRFSRWFVAALAATLLFTSASAQYPGAVPPPEHLKPGFDSIVAADARRWLGYLAGPECEGRGTGQPGFQKAADYVAAHFKAFGLKPVGENGSYFQYVPFIRSRVSPGASALSVVGGPKFERVRFTGVNRDVEASGPVLFLRATGPEPSLEDPKVLEGKVVVVSTSQLQRSLRAQLLANGAVAVITVVEKAPNPAEWSVRPVSAGRQVGGAGGAQSALRASIGLEDAKALARAVGVTDRVVSLEPAENSTVVLQSGTKIVSLVAKIETENIRVPNVVGLLEGSDPKLKEEVVGMGAHLDHEGVRDGVVYWGADDDASGSTALLLAARALSENPQKPKRSVLFMAFCGEELGLVGSRYYADNPIIPNERMICELQMDMVGRNEEGPNDKPEDNVHTIHLVGSKRISTELHDLVIEMNKHIGFEFEYDEEGVYTRSDHYSFAAKGIPIAFLFSGFHPDYHRPTDTPDKINYDKIVNTAKLFYLVAWNAANRDAPFAKNVGGNP